MITVKHKEANLIERAFLLNVYIAKLSSHGYFKKKSKDLGRRSKTEKLWFS